MIALIPKFVAVGMVVYGFASGQLLMAVIGVGTLATCFLIDYVLGKMGNPVAIPAGKYQTMCESEEKRLRDKYGVPRPNRPENLDAIFESRGAVRVIQFSMNYVDRPNGRTWRRCNRQEIDFFAGGEAYAAVSTAFASQLEWNKRLLVRVTADVETFGKGADISAFHITTNFSESTYGGPSGCGMETHLFVEELCPMVRMPVWRPAP